MTPPLSIWAKPALTAKEDWVESGEEVVGRVCGLLEVVADMVGLLDSVPFV